MMRLQTTFLFASVLLHSDNIQVSGSGLEPSPKFFAWLGNSDISNPLGESLEEMTRCASNIYG
ncbi:hypothetical protein [Thermodesulfobium narugense]|nr:hypothetical protein [Thermodesulfobium narugense]